MAASGVFSATVHTEQKLQTLEDVIRRLIELGLTSFYGVRLISDVYVDMDGCREFNFSFSGEHITQIMLGYENPDVVDGYSPFAIPDHVESNDSTPYSKFQNRKVLYDWLDTELNERTWMMVLVRHNIPPCPAGLKHLLEFEDWEADLPVDEEANE